MSDLRGEYLDKGRSDIKYSEIVTMDDLVNCKNGNCGDQNQNSIDNANSSVCPLPTAVLLSNSGNPTTKAMEYPSKDDLDCEISRVRSSRYKKRAKILGIIAVTMTLSTIILAIILGSGIGYPASINKKPEQEVCTKTECVTAASRILNSMNLSADPCENFFEYACGKWILDHVIPEDKSSVSSFNDIRESVSLTLKRVLERDSEGDRAAIKKAKYHYKACMNTAQIDRQGGKPALDIVSELGGMPLFGDPLVDFKLEEALANALAKYKSFSTVFMWMLPDDMNSSIYSVQLDQPGLGMPDRDYYMDELKRNLTLPGYIKFMKDYLAMLWKEKDATSFNETALKITAEKIVQIETELASIMMKSEDKRDSSANYRKRSIQAMYDNINPDFDWMTYINTAFSNIGKSFDRSHEVVCYGDQYFTNFTKILAKYSNNELQDYIIWMLLKGRVSYLGKPFRDTEAPFRLAVFGTKKENARWQTCTRIVNWNFLMPVGALFVREAFTEENKAVAETMVENLRKTFLSFLPQNEWMDETTKEKAKTKANLIQPMIAYPDYILDPDDPKLDVDFEEAEVKDDDFFQNTQNLMFFSTKENMRKLDVLVNRKKDWITGPAIVNAYYTASQNQIVLPAGILQPPFYDAGQPNSMNYGGIGMVIGHEITHGFDDTGSKFNSFGNMEEWWTNRSRQNFNEKAKCMEKQYSNYYWEDAKSNLNGKLTLGENIADNGGIREAYHAYQRWKAENGADLLLPGLQEFTHEQLFFLSMAQVWCGLYRPAYAVRLVAIDTHSPGLYRVIGSISNFEEFGKAYGCKRGQSPMQPPEEDTCRIW